MTVRTRFAPSPTGTLHIGGARTALFSWLYARRHGGQFILRMEDTDLARSTQESVDQVLRDLRWLGLDWDEGPAADGRGSLGPVGPYFQSRRLDTYAGYLAQLKAKGLAYPCFDSKAEVEAEREAAIAEGRAPTGAFEEASPAQIEAMRAKGLQPAWRFRIPEGGVTEFEDLVHGRMRFENRLMADFVIVRSDGMPTYNFAATVDDSLMEISHVIRGDDHLSNTPRQVCLYRALGLREPAFAHIPMILGPDKQRLSKRHGATAVGEYETQGFLPEALVNYLALLGWSLDDKTTLISVQELVESFSLERVTKHAAVFDPVKLAWMNGIYVRQAQDARLAPLIREQFKRAGLENADGAWWQRLAHALKEKVRTLAELPPENAFFFRRPEAGPEAREKFLQAGGPTWAPRLAGLLAKPAFDEASLEAALREFCGAEGLKFKDAVAVLRCAVSGQTVTPGLFETLALLGREECLARLTLAGGWS
ncbi:MAG TPA: glutamate--tRNA ligase [bacterium]|jgi:glutamyl-tRNA synthetase|nr:glutamate--tRNA ligase [bacterium]